jgi:hypothetical protein
LFKSGSRNVDAALVQENEILIFNLHGTAPKQITSISAEEHLEDKYSRIPANVCPFTISELWCHLVFISVLCKQRNRISCLHHKEQQDSTLQKVDDNT